MLLKQARTVCSKKWAAQHECEELRKQFDWKPIQARMRRKTNELWIDKHRNVMRKLVVEVGCVQTRMCEFGGSNMKKCRGCNNEEGTEEHRLYHCPSWREVRNQILVGLWKWE